jgi:hypothetical protein
MGLHRTTQSKVATEILNQTGKDWDRDDKRQKVGIFFFIFAFCLLPYQEEAINQDMSATAECH